VITWYVLRGDQVGFAVKIATWVAAQSTAPITVWRRSRHVLRVTCYVLRVTCYVLRNTYVTRNTGIGGFAATCYVLRVTCYVLRITCYVCNT